MRDWDEICRLIEQCRQHRGPIIDRMKMVLDRYEGEVVVPIPELANEPIMPMLTPALVGQAINDHALRAASVRPTVFCPAVNPRNTQGKGSLEWAQKRRRFISYVYAESKWQLGRRKSYRQLGGYATSSLIIKADPKTKMPRIEVRDPLGTLSDPTADDGLRQPQWVAYISALSGAYLRRMYPRCCSEVGGPITDQDQHLLWNYAEFIDEECIVYGLVGAIQPFGEHIASDYLSSNIQPTMQLSPAFPNRAEMMTAIIPNNVTLGRLASSVSQMIGSVDLQAKLTALSILAQERGIFPDMYVLGNENENPRLISGDWQDGRTGNPNLIAGAQAVGLLHVNSDPSINTTIDRQERNYKNAVNLVPQQAGETYGALRTGRGIDALAGMSVDPYIQEMHEIHEAFMSDANKAIFAVAKGYYSQKKFVVFSGWEGDKGQLELIPGKHIESYDNSVCYSIAGADVSQQTQIVGSLFGARLLSRQTARTLHPLIKDPQLEEEQLRVEELESALQQAMAQQMLMGQLPLALASLIQEQLIKGKTMFEAVSIANEQLQKQQAAQPPPVPEGMAAAPESMPGIAAGPSAMQAPPQPQPGVEVPTDAAAMNQLMSVMGGR